MADKRLILIRRVASTPLLKSHVRDYTRKDGTPVKAHDDKRQKKAEEGYSHPHSVGKAVITDTQCEGFGDCSGIKFAGTQYFSTGKTGKSFHDETPVREFESEDGHRVWVDEHGRVHADSKDEVPKLRAKHEAHTSAEQEESADPPLEDKDRHDAGEGDPVHDEQRGGKAASQPKDTDSGGAAASRGKSKDEDGLPDLEAMSDDQLNELVGAVTAELKKRGGGSDMAKADETGDTLDGRGPEHEDQQDDEDPGEDGKKKRKGDILAKAIADGVRLLLGRGK